MTILSWSDLICQRHSVTNPLYGDFVSFAAIYGGIKYSRSEKISEMRVFFEWDGDVTGSVNPATLIMDGDKTVTARFSDPVYYTLQVDVHGLGVVNVEPDLDEYLHGSLVTLQAVPESGWLFSSWSGDLTGGQSPVVLLVTTDLAITANFIEADYQIFLPLIFR